MRSEHRVSHVRQPNSQPPPSPVPTLVVQVSCSAPHRSVWERETELSWSSMSLHEVPLTCMQFHELVFSSFLCLSSSQEFRSACLPYHSVDRGVERLTLFPEYRENKAVEAKPNDAHQSWPAQPAVAVDLFLNIIDVQITGALTDHTVSHSIQSSQKCFFTWDMKVHFHPQKRVEW